MYPRIPWKLVANPFGSAKHTLGTPGISDVALEYLRQRTAWDWNPVYLSDTDMLQV